MDHNVYQILITLDAVRPKVWRRIVVSPDTPLPDFHLIIQAVMGWEAYHMYDFIKDRKHYQEIVSQDQKMTGKLDVKNYKVADLLKFENDTVSYEYDFGDQWIHNILLEKILHGDQKPEFPMCIEGARNCPPEDIGGNKGYQNLINCLQNPEDPENAEFLDYYDMADYDPEFFSLDQVNKLLKMENCGFEVEDYEEWDESDMVFDGEEGDEDFDDFDDDDDIDDDDDYLDYN